MAAILQKRLRPEGRASRNYYNEALAEHIVGSWMGPFVPTRVSCHRLRA